MKKLDVNVVWLTCVCNEQYHDRWQTNKENKRNLVTHETLSLIIIIILNNNHNDNNNLIISGQTLGFLLTIDLLVSDNGIPKFSNPTST